MNPESAALRIAVSLVRFVVLLVVYGVVALIGAVLLITFGGFVYKSFGAWGILLIGCVLWYFGHKRRRQVLDAEDNTMRDMQEFRNVWMVLLQEARGKIHQPHIYEAYRCTEHSDNRQIAREFYALLMRWSRGSGLEDVFRQQWRTTLQAYVRNGKPVFTGACLIELSRLMASASILTSQMTRQTNRSYQKNYQGTNQNNSQNTRQNAGWQSYQRAYQRNGWGSGQAGGGQTGQGANGAGAGGQRRRGASGASSAGGAGYGSQSGSYNRSRRSTMRQAKAWYVVLGVAEEASVEVIKKAYRRKIVENHPDRVAYLGERKRRAAEESSKEINEAFQYIKKYRGF